MTQVPTDTEILNWLLSRVEYLEHKDSLGRNARLQEQGGYWPQTSEDCEGAADQRFVGLNLRDYIKAVMGAENQRLHQVCRDAYEVWAGSEGIPEPETCAEQYLYDLLIKMRDEVKRGL